MGPLPNGEGICSCQRDGMDRGRLVRRMAQVRNIERTCDSGRATRMEEECYASNHPQRTVGATAEAGQEVARRLSADYVDRQVLAEAGRRTGTTEAALAVQEGRARSFMERLHDSLERSIKRLAAAPAISDDSAPGGWASFLGLPYLEAEGPLGEDTPLGDELFFRVVNAVIHELVASGNVVIVGRVSNQVLKDRHPVLHVRSVAPLLFRVEAIMKRERLTQPEAVRFVRDQERARVAHYQRFFKADAHDALPYDLAVNLGSLGVDHAAEIIVHAAALKA